jgi:hypothetical protein
MAETIAKADEEETHACPNGLQTALFLMVRSK